MCKIKDLDSRGIGKSIFRARMNTWMYVAGTKKRTVEVERVRRRANLLRMHVFAFNTFFDDVDRGVSSTCARVHAYVCGNQQATGCR